MAGTIADRVLARRDDSGRALLFEDREWSWQQVVSEACARAGVLAELRRPGPFHVGVLLDNVPEYVFWLFGAALAGATVVGINPTRRGEELERDVRHTDCQAIVTDGTGAELLDGLELGVPEGSVLVLDTPEYDRLISRHAADDPPSEEKLPGPESLYLLIFTSGSTGAPKAVRMTHGRADGTASGSAMAFSPDDVLYCAMPLFHANALVANLFPATITGATVALRRKFSATGFTEDLRRYGCTFFNYVGRALSYILAVPESPSDRDNSLKWILGSEASPRDRAEFRRRFGCPVFEGYGSSENAVIISPVPGTPRASLGKPRPGMEVAILDRETGAEKAVAELDEAGRLLNPEEAVGEIVGRNTVGHFEGYYKNPEAEADRIREGLYWTGDLGYVDAEGFVYFAGRTADWLRVDGENFSAGAVERVLGRWGPATSAVVYGVPDPVTGDQVMAALIMAPGTEFDAEEFTEFLESEPDLGTKWAPRFVRVAPDLPLTGVGKVDKAPLRAAAWCTSDPVWWRPERGAAYRLLDEEDRGALQARFAENGREQFLPDPTRAG